MWTLLALACSRPAPEPAPQVPPAAPPIVISTKHLEGWWRSEADPAAEIYIEKTTWVEMQGGAQRKRAVFELADGCRPGGRPAAGGGYLNLLEREGPTCYRLVRADGQVLEIALQPGGSSQRYVRAGDE